MLNKTAAPASREVLETSSALHALGVERLRDLALGFERGTDSLVQYGYPDTDRARVLELTRGLKLDHVGVLIGCPWSDIESFVGPVIGEPAEIRAAKSVLVKARMNERTGIELPVEIHFIRFRDPKFPGLEVFTVENDRLEHTQAKLAEFSAGNDFHLAFRVTADNTAAAARRLGDLSVPESSRGTHIFTGESCRYYDLGGEWRRNIELLWPA